MTNVETRRHTLFASPEPPAMMGVKGNQAVTRSNILYLIIGALVVVVAVLSYRLYQDRKQPADGVHIDVGPNGLSIEKK